METALGGVIGRLRTLSYDHEHQRCDARHIHSELQEIISELECILAKSSAGSVLGQPSLGAAARPVGRRPT